MVTNRTIKSKLFLSQATSKGNQLKFREGNRYVKADMFGYESIAEALASELEEYIVDFPHINYWLEEATVQGKKLCCCYSEDFSQPNLVEISLYQILDKYLGDSGMEKLASLNGRVFLSEVEKNVSLSTGLEIHNYLGRMMYFDAIILNEDRHLNNISFWKNTITGEYSYMPVYDNGLSLLSDTSLYTITSRNLKSMCRKVKSKPFSTSFKTQVSYFKDNVEPLHIDVYSLNNKLNQILENIDMYVPFKQREFRRAVSVLRMQLIETEGKLWV